MALLSRFFDRGTSCSSSRRLLFSHEQSSHQEEISGEKTSCSWELYHAMLPYAVHAWQTGRYASKYDGRLFDLSAGQGCSKRTSRVHLDTSIPSGDALCCASPPS